MALSNLILTVLYRRKKRRLRYHEKGMIECKLAVRMYRMNAIEQEDTLTGLVAC